MQARGCCSEPKHISSLFSNDAYVLMNVALRETMENKVFLKRANKPGEPLTRVFLNCIKESKDCKLVMHTS